MTTYGGAARWVLRVVLGVVCVLTLVTCVFVLFSDGFVPSWLVWVETAVNRPGFAGGSVTLNRPGSDGDLVQATSRSEVAVEH